MACTICEDQVLLYEDKDVKAFLVEKAASKGHIIVTTKAHLPILESVPDDLAVKVFLVANKLSTVLFEAIGAQGSNILVNNGIDAGQKDPHFTVHVIPRKDNDGLSFEWQPKKASEEELADILSKLAQDLEKKPEIVEPEAADEEDDGTNYLIKSLDRVP